MITGVNEKYAMVKNKGSRETSIIDIKIREPGEEWTEGQFLTVETACSASVAL